MKCHSGEGEREIRMRGDFVKIKKRVAVTNQYAAAIRDDKERKKAGKCTKSMTRLLSSRGSFRVLLAKKQATAGTKGEMEKLFMTFYTLR